MENIIYDVLFTRNKQIKKSVIELVRDLVLEEYNDLYPSYDRPLNFEKLMIVDDYPFEVTVIHTKDLMNKVIIRPVVNNKNEFVQVEDVVGKYNVSNNDSDTVSRSYTAFFGRYYPAPLGTLKSQMAEKLSNLSKEEMLNAFENYYSEILSALNEPIPRI